MGNIMNLEEYHPGSGCECFARHEDECGCDADWTPKEVYELRKRIAELEQAIMSNCYDDSSAAGKRLMALVTKQPEVK